MLQVFVLILFACAFALAQETAGSIAGRVLDPSGAAVPGAQISALHRDTGVTRKTVSNADGNYAFPILPIGTYEITASAPGFKKFVQKDVALHVSERLGINIELQVGEVSQEVSVVASAEQLQTESSDQGGLISGEQIRELQLNGRSFMTLLELIPGVASNMSDRQDPNSTPNVSINGARSTGSSFNIDGGNNSDVIVGSSSLNTFTSLESIAEFTVLTSTFSAEYGRGGFSQVNVVTKSGTRQYRGSVYHFLRNDAFDAKDYFSHLTLPLKLNNFGYTLGGPISFGQYNRDRNKTFFFFSQEFNRVVQRGEAINILVPTAEERRGDFRAYGPGNDRAFGTADDPVIDPTTRVGFPGGVIPASRLDPNAVKLLNLYPLPNFAGPGNINYTSAAPSRQNWHEEMIRIDHNFSDRWRIYGRYTQDSAYVRNPYGGSGLTSVTTRFPGVATTNSDRPGKNFVLSSSQTISPSVLNQAQFSFARRYFDMRSISEIADRTKLGLTIPELFPENEGNIIPQVNLGSGYAAINVPRRGHKELFTLEVTDNFSKIAGKHLLKFGGIYSYGGNLEQPFSPNTSGSLTYTTNNARHPVANMLLGLPTQYSEVEKTIWSDARFAMLEAYAQDDIRATSRLTLNLGVRYSAFFNPYDRNNQVANFLPWLWDRTKAMRVNAANGQLIPNSGDPLNGVVIAGKNSPYGRRVANNHTKLFAPRVGFAWAPKGRKSVIRGGYGMFFTRPLIGTFINNTFDNPPFSRSVTITNPVLQNAVSGAEAPANPPNFTALGDPLKAPTVHQWSFGQQRDIMGLGILNVSYVGTRGLRLQRPLNINNPPAGSVPANVNVNAVRPYTGWGNITQRQTTGSSIYHSLQVSFNRRMRGRLSAGGAFTWAKSIDDGSSERGAGDVPPNSHNIRAERGPSDFDRTLVFTGNFVWRLPYFRKNQAFVRHALGGWQASGIVRMWSGRPFDVVMSSDVAGIGAVQNQRPDVIADTKGPRTVEEWFNRSAFARPRTGTFGNMGRNSLRGPGVNKWDLSLFKNFTLSERLRLQFRSEFFNAFNHPSFTTVGSTLTVTATGVNPLLNNFAVVTGTRDARVLQFALKLTF
jgi:hypothetical protein